MTDPEDLPAHPRRVPASEVLHLAVPAFLALIAEPLFLLADSAIIGFLGTTSLAGLGVASAVLLTAVQLCVFLAYGTTAVVARHLGAGDQRRALAAGVDGMWLSLVLGLAIMGGTMVWATELVQIFGAGPEATSEAVVYLRISTLGIPAMLVVLAATGVLRGLLDTRTPLLAAVVGFSGNAVLSLLFVHGFGWGIGGAAWGSVIAQTGMAIALTWVVVRGARTYGASLRFHASGVLRAALDGIPLVIRTISLRAAALLTIWVAADLGVEELAAHQVAVTYWGALALALDALAIAAQALTGRALGAGNVDEVRSLTWMLVRWGIAFGVVLGIFTVALHNLIPLGFSTDEQVRSALAAALLVVGLSAPISGVAFVVDGILIGAGDARWLAFAQTMFLLAYIPMLLAVRSSNVSGIEGLVWLWIAFTGFMVVRAAGLVWRARGDRWLVTGGSR